MHGTKRQFTLFELAMVTVIVAILFSIVLNRLFYLMVEVERVNLLQVEAAIKSALGLELSRRVLDGELDSIGDLEGINPLDLLQEMPHNYLGARKRPNLATLSKSAWVFDSSRRVLIYTVNNTDYFQTDLPGRSRTEYRLVLNYIDNNHNGRFDYKIDRLSGVKLASLGNYQWYSIKK